MKFNSGEDPSVGSRCFGGTNGQNVIPRCDGDGSEKDFRKLLTDLWQEFHPVGPLERFYVTSIVECMWKLRRANIAERGSVRNAAVWNGAPPNILELAKPYTLQLAIVLTIEETIKTTGTLSTPDYEMVLPILILHHLPPSSSAPEDVSACLQKCRKKLEYNIEAFRMLEKPMSEDYFAGHALPPEAAMNQILRYGKAAQKKLEWAYKMLIDLQNRRNKNKI